MCYNSGFALCTRIVTPNVLHLNKDLSFLFFFFCPSALLNSPISLPFLLAPLSSPRNHPLARHLKAFDYLLMVHNALLSLTNHSAPITPN